LSVMSIPHQSIATKAAKQFSDGPDAQSKMR
jgi:hypothetical protein